MQQSERLLFSAPVKSDFDRYYQINSDPQTNLFNPAGPMDEEKAIIGFDRFMKHWELFGFGSWTIREKSSGTIIGFGGISKRMYGAEEKLNLGYRLATEFWGKGYATELSMYAVAHAFNILKAGKLFAIVRPNHEASIRVLEKCGMQLFGTLDDVAGEAQSLVYQMCHSG